METLKTIGIIGCAGFIGSHLITKLLSDEKYIVRGIDVVSKKIDHLLGNPRFVFSCVNTTGMPGLREWIEECDCVIQLAAICNPSFYTQIPIQVIQSNFLQTVPIIELCAELQKRLIYFSTCEVYGKTVQGIVGQKLKDTEDRETFLLQEDSSHLILGPVTSQRWCYSSAKQLMERFIVAYGFEKNLNYTIIRPFNFIGPAMDYLPGIDGNGVPRVIACFMHSLVRGEPLHLVDGGHNRRCFTAIDDAIHALVAIVERPEQSKKQIFNIGNPKNEITIRQLASLMQSMCKNLYPHRTWPSEISDIDAFTFYGAGYEDSDRRVPDITKAQQLLGWQPAIGIEDILKRTINYFVELFDTSNMKKNVE